MASPTLLESIGNALSRTFAMALAGRILQQFPEANIPLGELQVFLQGECTRELGSSAPLVATSVVVNGQQGKKASARRKKTGYNMFSKAFWDDLKSKHVEGQPKAQLADVTSEIGKAWKLVPEEEKAKWNALAAAENEKLLSGSDGEGGQMGVLAPRVVPSSASTSSGSSSPTRKGKFAPPEGTVLLTPEVELNSDVKAKRWEGNWTLTFRGESAGTYKVVSPRNKTVTGRFGPGGQEIPLSWRDWEYLKTWGLPACVPAAIVEANMPGSEQVPHEDVTVLPVLTAPIAAAASLPVPPAPEGSNPLAVPASLPPLPPAPPVA